jgi:ELWxxDGT repeat protein
MSNTIKLSLITVITVVLTAGFIACGGGGGGGDSGGTGSTAEQFQVSAASGADCEYTSPDNPNIAATLLFEPGAVAADTTITIDLSSAVSDSNVIPGLGFEFSPDGLSFAGTVTFVVTYDETALGGADESGLKIHKWTSGQWQSLPSIVDTTANTVTANLSGFSEYYVFPEESQKLYFTADDGSGWSVWSWDGSELLMEPDTSSSNTTGWPMMYREFNDKLYFVMNYGQLWSYDGSQAASVEVLGNIGHAGGSSNMGILPFNDKLYFTGKLTTTWELWSYSEAAGLIQETDTSGSTTYMPQGYMVYDDKIFFEGGEGSSNRELYSFDGINAPVVAADINSAGSSEPDGLTSFNGTLYFSADDGIHGRELWAYSSSEGAYMVKDIFPGDQNDDGITFPGGGQHEGANQFTPFNGKLYFAAASTTGGSNLWVTDGTADGTTTVPNATMSYSVGGIKSMTVMDDRLYFAAPGSYGSTDHYVSVLWVYDTADDTTPKPIPGTGLNLYDIITFNGKLYFRGLVDGSYHLMSCDGINAPVQEATLTTNHDQSWMLFLEDSAIY